jgi:hypothetical protein
MNPRPPKPKDESAVTFSPLGFVSGARSPEGPVLTEHTTTYMLRSQQPESGCSSQGLPGALIPPMETQQEAGWLTLLGRPAAIAAWGISILLFNSTELSTNNIHFQ